MYNAAMIESATAYWQELYATKDPARVSWYRSHLHTSLELMEVGGLHAGSRVIDVGGGASTLVDDLLARDVRRITILDLSVASLQHARGRLGPLASTVRWMAADILEAPIEPASMDFWHDRAALHFLDAAADCR